MNSLEEIRVCAVGDVTPERPFVFRHPDVGEIVIFRTEEGFFAVENRCPHAGGSLHEGIVEGTILTCIWHGWRFHLPTGQCLNEYWAKLRVYPLKSVGGSLYVILDTEK